jgi:hypothetical protein
LRASDRFDGILLMDEQPFKARNVLAPLSCGRICRRSRLRSIPWILCLSSRIRFRDMESFLDGFLEIYMDRNGNWFCCLDDLARIFQSLTRNDVTLFIKVERSLPYICNAITISAFALNGTASKCNTITCSGRNPEDWYVRLLRSLKSTSNAVP